MNQNDNNENSVMKQVINISYNKIVIKIIMMMMMMMMITISCKQ